jgi:hypothetical protein
MGKLLLFSGGLFLMCLVSSVFGNWVEWFEFIKKIALFVDP